MVSEDAPTMWLLNTPGANETLDRSNQQALRGEFDWSAKLVQSCSYIRPVQKPVNWREYRLPVVYGQVDDELFPHSEWRDCARQALGMRNFLSMLVKMLLLKVQHIQIYEIYCYNALKQLLGCQLTLAD